jgi:hypothetical protein
MKQTAQVKGVIGESNLLEILSELLKKFSNVSSLRKYESGFQGGKDIKAEGFFKKRRNEVAEITSNKYRWFFEVKNYKSKLDLYKVTGKIHQITSSQNKIDVFCLFSPHEDISGIWEDSFEDDEKILQLPHCPFKIILWTPSKGIKENLKAFPEIYEKVYGEKIDITEKERSRILKNWIKEIIKATKEGNKIQKKYIELFKGDEQIWIPESIDNAKEIIRSARCLKEDGEKSDILNRKMKLGGIESESEILNAKTNRIMSEGIRRKYKKTNATFYSKLNELRQELYNFCSKIENGVLEKHKSDEAKIFFKEFSNKIIDFKQRYRDTALISRLPDFYYKGQMLDITGECLLSLSNKWLKGSKGL